MSPFLKYVIVFFISMVPLIELRGAVPYGITVLGLNEYLTLAICIIGNMLPVPIIYLFARKVLVWGSTWKHGKQLLHETRKRRTGCQNIRGSGRL